MQSTEISHVPHDSDRIATLARKHAAFWRGDEENSFLRSAGIFSPSAPIALPQGAGSKPIDHVEVLTPDLIHVDALIDDIERLYSAEPSEDIFIHGFCTFPGLGDLMPLSQPLAKIPWLEAAIGIPITMTEGHIWVGEPEESPEEFLKSWRNLDENPWLELYTRFLERLDDRLATREGGRFPVSANTLFRGPSDLAAAVLGAAEACLGWIDDPELMSRLLRLGVDANLTFIEQGRKTVQSFHAGSTDSDSLDSPDSYEGYMSAFGILAPHPVLRMQADHSSLLSPGIYREQILSFDRNVVRANPSSVFHIHNNGLHMSPYLVENPELDVVQVTIDPYPLGARKDYEIDMVRSIQAHKPVILDVNFPDWEEAEEFLSRLAQKRLCFNPRFSREEYARLPEEYPGREIWLMT